MSCSSNSNICNKNIKMVEAELAPGFRFHPRDDELVCDYLMKKVARSHQPNQPILLIQVDLNKCEPWDLPEVACVGGKEWYFYSQRDRKYATGVRTNRATTSGYWKATGKDRAIHRKGSLVGMRKTLVFYQGRAPKGRKTEWVMHEFRLEGPSFASPHKLPPLKEDWVLCRVFYKSRSEVSGQFQKQSNMGSNYSSSYDDDRVSSSLPPLMDSYITFDQTQPNLSDDYYTHHPQVPCFSNIFSPSSSHQQYPQTVPINNRNPNFSHSNHHFEPTNHFGKNLPAAASSACLDPFDCDKKVTRAVLNQLTKTDQSIGSAPNNVNGNGSSPSSESYLSEVGMPPTNFWSPY